MPKNVAVLLSAGALALGVAACGGSSSSSFSAPGTSPAAAASTSSAAPAAATTSAAASSSAPSAGGSTRLAIAANPTGMLMFDKTTLSAKAGTVVITFTNKASEGHNFTVQSSAGSTVGATPTFSGGTKTLALKLKAGKYTYFCSVPGHEQAGMKGTLTVS
jgi:plastocyanin